MIQRGPSQPGGPLTVIPRRHDPSASQQHHGSFARAESVCRSYSLSANHLVQTCAWSEVTAGRIKADDCLREPPQRGHNQRDAPRRMRNQLGSVFVSMWREDAHV